MKAFKSILTSYDVQAAMAEDMTNSYALLHLRGKQLTLPFGEKHFRKADNLAWHREPVSKR